MANLLFDPESNGLKLQRGFETAHMENVVEDMGELGNKRVTAIAEKLPRRWRLPYRAFGRTARGYLLAFYRKHVGAAGIFDFDAPEYVPDPFFAPTVEAVSGGTQSQQEIDVGFTWKNSQGETLISTLAEITIPANNLLKVTLPVYPPSVSQAVIYAVDGVGTPQSQTTLTDIRTWTQPDAPLLVATSDPPSTNTATERVQVRFVKQSLREIRQIGETYELSVDVEEVY